MEPLYIRSAKFKEEVLATILRTIATPIFEERIRNGFENAWRWFDQRPSVKIPKTRIGRGQGGGRGVDRAYDSRLAPLLAQLIYRRIIDNVPAAEFDLQVYRALINGGFATDPQIWLVNYAYERAVCDILNLKETEEDEFHREIQRILVSRDLHVAFEWANDAIRRHAEYSDSSNWRRPPKVTIDLLGLGLESFMDRPAKVSMTAENEDGIFIEQRITSQAIANFQKNRRLYARLIESVLKKDMDDLRSAEKLYQAYKKTLDYRPTDWLNNTYGEQIRDGSAPAPINAVLKWRPPNLVDFVVFRLGWLADHFGRSFAQVCHERLFLCVTPECGRFEVVVSRGRNRKCRRCRGLDGRVEPKKRGRRPGSKSRPLE